MRSPRIQLHDLSAVLGAQEGSLGLDSGLLGKRAYTGPLVGGSVSNKELLRWLDERATKAEEEGHQGSLRLLWGLLRICCQHYGKLRSVGAAGLAGKEDGPEAALAKLLAAGSVKAPDAWGNSHFQHSSPLLPAPPPEQQQAAALEMKHLLVLGKRTEALQIAVHNQLWGLALLLARKLGEKVYSDTVLQMARLQFTNGSALRTLVLLLAGQPAEIFAVGSSSGGPVGDPGLVDNLGQGAGLGSMLDEWQENLAILAANSIGGEESVMQYLGDCLWRTRGQVAAAHMCYLLGNRSPEPYSDSARVCLLGADHWKNVRTFASSEAIQRTEVYEYAKVQGNSQYVLAAFQPYKILHASMLAEVGKTPEALRYCQAVQKILRTAGKTPDIDAWKAAAASLEDRLKVNIQGSGASAYGSKVIGGFMGLLDRGIHRIIGGAPPQPPLPSGPGSKSAGNTRPGTPELAPVPAHPGLSQSFHPAYGQSDFFFQVTTGSGPAATAAAGLSLSAYSNEAASSSGQTSDASGLHAPAPMAPFVLPPSAADRPTEAPEGKERVSVPTRSVSEPDFSRSPAQEDVQQKAESTSGGSSPPKRTTSATSAAAPPGMMRSVSGFLSRATAGVGSMVFKPKKEAKLGEKNTFYYDEKLKRWVEEGHEDAAQEAPLPPPPTTMKQTGRHLEPDAAGSGQPGSSSPAATVSTAVPSGTPPIPPSGSQSASRARGVRSRYVDTFNKGKSATASVPGTLAFAPIVKTAIGGPPVKPKSFMVPDAVPPCDVSNGEVPSNSAKQVDEQEYEVPDRRSSPQPQQFVAQLHRVASADNARALNGVASSGAFQEESNTLASDPAPNHTRANSWSGYPTGFSVLSTLTVPDVNTIASSNAPPASYFDTTYTYLESSDPSSSGPSEDHRKSNGLSEPVLRVASANLSHKTDLVDNLSALEVNGGREPRSTVAATDDMTDVEL
eukprot:SM000301S11769  [mRNA]  locus=s301:27656:32480:- [translate_table: standard]